MYCTNGQFIDEGVSEQLLRDHGGFWMPEPCEAVKTDVVRVAMVKCRLTSINEYGGFISTPAYRGVRGYQHKKQDHLGSAWCAKGGAQEANASVVLWQLVRHVFWMSIG